MTKVPIVNPDKTNAGGAGAGEGAAAARVGGETRGGAAGHRFVATAGQSLDRLDKYVVERMAEAGDIASRSAVQRWIKAGRVTVEGRSASPSDSLIAGAVVDVEPLPPETTELEPDPSVDFDVLYEDAHLVVVNKPGGLVVHPGRGHAQKTLVHGLLARASFPKGGDVFIDRDGEPGAATVRPGIVHRLDKGTSGILVVAKDERTREGLKAQFAAHSIERAYWTIVVGAAVSADYDTLHGRHPTDRLRFTTRVNRGRRAITHVRVLEKLGTSAASLAGGKTRATLVECRLETGRTHQIRVHLAECAKTPILGDPLYAKEPADPLLKEVARQLGRQALHARVLGFVHPVTGEHLRFEREPPRDFQAALDALRAGSTR
jgi:23S rRNA pseudouridine1911/1915/1917 synthase